MQDYMRRLATYIPTILIALLILYLSLLRETHLTLPAFIGADKLAHAAFYALLAGCFTLNRYQDKGTGWTCTWLVIAISTAYGGIIELLQEYFFPPRTGEWTDWAADLIGAMAGTLIVRQLWKYRKRNYTT